MVQAQITGLQQAPLYRFTLILLSLAFSWWRGDNTRFLTPQSGGISTSPWQGLRWECPHAQLAQWGWHPPACRPCHSLSNSCYASQVQSEGCKRCPVFLPRAGGRETEEIYWVTEQAWGSQTLLIAKGNSNFCPSELGARGNWDSERCLSNRVRSSLGFWLPAALA